jgi:hypothetical protein
MPTILQLPPVSQITSADELPLSQAGVTSSVSVGALLAGTQSAITASPGTLLGRVSFGPGGPELVPVGLGLVLSGGALAASGADHATFSQQATLATTDQVVLNSVGRPMLLSLSLLRGLFSAGANISIDPSGTISANATGTSGETGSFNIGSLPSVGTVAATDLVAISQAGTDHSISYANLLDGLTIDLAQPATPAADSDTFWVAQGSSTMSRQTFAALWSWLTPKLPSYKLPVIEITTNTTLDGTVHNGRMLICSQPITLSPASVNMGSGFNCDVLNLSSGAVTFAAGITTSSGSATLPSGQYASLLVASYSGGTVVFAALSGGGSGGTPITPPGQVMSLVASGPTSTSVALNWSAPSSGGAVNSYTVQYRIAGTTTWSTFATGLTTASASVTGLIAATAYGFQVYATNGGGAGLPSSVASASTNTATTGAVTAITWEVVPSGSYAHGAGSIGMNAHITPSAATVQFGFSTSSTVPPTSWVLAGFVNSNLWGAYVSTPAVAGTWYAWVEGTDGSSPTVYATPFTVT